MAPKFVAPYRMSGRQDKNDAADALAICETVQRQLRALCRGRNSAFFQRGISSPHDGRWGRGFLQLPRATPISPHRAGWEMARGPGDVVEDRDRMAGSLLPRQRAADAA